MAEIKYMIRCKPIHMWQSNEEPADNYIDVFAHSWAPYPSDNPNKIKFVNVYLDRYLFRRPLRDSITGRYTYLIASVDPEVWKSYPTPVPGLVDRTFMIEVDLSPALPMLRETPTNMSIFVIGFCNAHAQQTDENKQRNCIV